MSKTALETTPGSGDCDSLFVTRCTQEIRQWLSTHCSYKRAKRFRFHEFDSMLIQNSEMPTSEKPTPFVPYASKQMEQVTR